MKRQPPKQAGAERVREAHSVDEEQVAEVAQRWELVRLRPRLHVL